MAHIPADLHSLVTNRAGGRCEYCGLAQAGQEATFHIDHIIPRTDAGPTNADNLGLACVSCSLRKAARRTGVDPETGKPAPLFHPRTDTWPDHFRWTGVVLLGTTPTGRATITALHMNRPLILAIRAEESHHGRHPPPSPTSD